MRKIFFILVSLNILLLASCDDGDIITTELDFDNNFEVCASGRDLVFFKTKNEPSESLSLKVANLSLADLIAVDEFGVFIDTLNITTTNIFNYRTYRNATLPSDLFCNAIPNSNVSITQDVESTSGTAPIKTILTEDDDDGISIELDVDINNNNDTDGDGLPNFIDADDDGDNVLTKDENPDPNGDGNLDDAQDTDEDGIPDYLDADDDGDGINTRDEENDSQNQNPADDITVNGLPDYLNKDVANLNTPAATAFREHLISQNYVITVQIKDIDLELISLDTFNFGVLNNSITTSSRRVVPEFR